MSLLTFCGSLIGRVVALACCCRDWETRGQIPASRLEETPSQRSSPTKSDQAVSTGSGN